MELIKLEVLKQGVEDLQTTLNEDLARIIGQIKWVREQGNLSEKAVARANDQEAFVNRILAYEKAVLTLREAYEAELMRLAGDAYVEGLNKRNMRIAAERDHWKQYADEMNEMFQQLGQQWLQQNKRWRDAQKTQPTT